MKAALTALLLASPAFADDAIVTGVTWQRSGDTIRVDVTLLHPDTGWEHYADAWRVESEDGTALGTRTLAHPHVEEQPFTRSLAGVVLPEGTKRIKVRARCLKDGWGADAMSFTVD